ncbi:hypothetical protein ACHHYP_02011 [Achlya hypogyna]|uniref:Uncharacterized protein n=1 Tax=Achlya hypogyna TaxID=1202772 RepID=A0A1V9Z7J3_ACHHY|nr:hypothetical protein ACHHYP_02011 [Achlya hypogyna]
MLTLEYATPDGALYHHEVVLTRYLSSSQAPEAVAAALATAEPAYFGPIPVSQLARLVQRLSAPTPTNLPRNLRQ